MKRWQTDEEKGDGEPGLNGVRVLKCGWFESRNSHCPWQSQYPYRRPHTEQDVPCEGSDKEDGSDDVQVGVGLRVVSGQQSQLEGRLKLCRG